jgi:hypothetical protein
MESDSREYNILVRAVIIIKSIEGLTCEIGVRKGGSTQYILDTLKNTKQNTYCYRSFWKHRLY